MSRTVVELVHLLWLLLAFLAPVRSYTPRVAYLDRRAVVERAQAPPSKRKMTLGYGIIGVGQMGREHIKNLQLLREDGMDLRLTAVADSHAESLELTRALLDTLPDMGKPQVYENYEDLINDDSVDVIVICTPNMHHVEVLRAVIPSGKHVLVEKPMCTTPADCLEVHSLVSRSGLYGPQKAVFWVAMEYRYIRPIERLLEIADSGDIGRVRMVSIREHRYPFLIKVGNWNRFSKNTGGTLVEKCCHFFDLMLRIVGSSPVRVYASGAMDVNHQDESYDGAVPDIIDNAFVLVDFQCGARACLDLCMFAEASENQEELVVVGDAGKVEAKVPVDEVTIGMREQGGQRPIETIPPPEDAKKVVKESTPVAERLREAGYHEGSTYWEHVNFYQCISKDEDDASRLADVALQDGLMAVMVGAAAELSVKEGRPIMMSELVQDSLRDSTAELVASRIPRKEKEANL